MVVIFDIDIHSAYKRAIRDLLGHSAVGVDVHAVNALVSVVLGDKPFELLNGLRGIYGFPDTAFKFARGYYLPVITGDKMTPNILKPRSVLVG